MIIRARAAGSGNDLTGDITFYEFFEPPLESGTYTVSITQKVKGSGESAFEQEFPLPETKFAVQGVRFSLPPSFTHLRFPADGDQGEFSNVLPHVVFTVETLPWQRDLGDRTAADEANAVRRPWLVLLTFDDQDPPPPIVNGTLAAFDPATLPAGTVSYPDFEPELGQSLDDPVDYVDIPGSLFAAIAPARDETVWLAHARTVSDDALFRKALTLRGEVPAQKFSTVVSNRLPRPGSATTCCLVSLEGMGKFLPGGSSPVTTGSVRVAVLASWTFGAIDQAVTFANVFEALDIAPATLQVPYSAGAYPNDDVQNALAMGYGAFNHQTRNGARTVSWYRGPLLPYDNALYVEAPFAASDQLVRYNPDSGMFDVSLAAAWEIGRLAALQDKSFATTLYDWKRDQSGAAILEFEQELLAELLGTSGSAFRGDRRVHVSLMRNVVAPLLRSFLENARR